MWIRIWIALALTHVTCRLESQDLTWNASAAFSSLHLSGWTRTSNVVLRRKWAVWLCRRICWILVPHRQSPVLLGDFRVCGIWCNLGQRYAKFGKSSDFKHPNRKHPTLSCSPAGFDRQILDPASGHKAAQGPARWSLAVRKMKNESWQEKTKYKPGPKLFLKTTVILLSQFHGFEWLQVAEALFWGALIAFDPWWRCLESRSRQIEEKKHAGKSCHINDIAIHTNTRL